MSAFNDINAKVTSNTLLPNASGGLVLRLTRYNTAMLEPGSEQLSPLTVSQLNRRVRQLLETHFPLLWIEGEISNLARPASGHIYFTLKDEQAQVRAAMFRNRNSLLNFNPADGVHVLVRGRVGLYEGRGEYQLIVEHMDEAGFGALQRKFEALKVKLADAGLFEQSHKKILPSYPRHLGIITSATGAALHDVLTVLARRFPALPVTVYPAMVQGQGAAAQLCRAITRANNDLVEIDGEKTTRCDILLLTRGGGSLEDLWAFNDEALAYAIYDSRLPIVSAVGHEVDFTIADFVADVRAPTPSAAAELISPEQNALFALLERYRSHLNRMVLTRLSQYRSHLDHLSKRIRHPRERLQDAHQRLDNLDLRLNHSLERELKKRRERFNGLAARIRHQHPETRLKAAGTQVRYLEHQLQNATRKLLQFRSQQWQSVITLLHSVSPLKTLDRGYAIVADQQGGIITSISQVDLGDTITTRVADGTIRSNVVGLAGQPTPVQD